MFEPIDVDVNADRHGRATSTIPIAGNGTDAASNAALSTLRNELLPADASATSPSVQYAVTGETAGTTTSTTQMKARMPLVFAFVLGLAFLLLLVTFRSIVIPIEAIVLNLLSVGAAYGVLVAGLPVRAGPRGCSASSSNGGDRLLAADVPVRDPVRPLDGLPRVHPQPDPRAASTAASSTEEAVAHGIKSHGRRRSRAPRS